MRRLVTYSVTLLWLARAASAQESLDDLDQAATASAPSPLEKPPIADVNGYVDDRFQYTLVNPTTTILPTKDLPSLYDLFEANVQLKVRLGAKAFAYGDLSLILQGGWLFYDRDAEGNRARVDEHDVPSQRPFVVPSELYVSWSPAPWLNLLAGKKRIVWGSGFAFNPTDLINPPRDPTDPSLQRAGGWVARLELPFEQFTVSALFSPSVLYQQSGLPYAMMKYPSYDVDVCGDPSVRQPFGDYSACRRAAPDDQYHYLVAARVYTLLFNTDVNFFYWFSNQYRDGFKNKSRFGVSLSRYFFTDYELHLEALLQSGSARLFPAGGTLAATRLEDDAITPRVLVGGRTMFKDESTLSVEYYWQGDGYSDEEFADFVRLLAKARPLLAMSQGGLPVADAGASGGLPQRFAFDPLRRHYLIVAYTKPKIRDDWTVGATTILGLRDLSGLFSPSVTWNALEWLNLTLALYVPIRGIPVGEAQVDGRGYSEYSLAPFDFRAQLSVRAFY